ncbi:PEP-CTERM sorting domain-containing protein [Kiritimatiellaeota bacterium B1221]|nr:PEP-CTERM sorting domain-containing protein [Kiritimatiellaeota bacterium B1221]
MMKTTFSIPRNLMRYLLSVLGLGMAQMAFASTVLYYRMGDDGTILTDSSGNGHHATGANATSVSIPETGDGSSFSNPIPSTAASNSKMGAFAGSQNIAIADPFNLGAFTAEAYINLESYDSSTQYVMSQWNASAGGRSWAFGVAASGGTGGAGGNEMFINLSNTGNDNNITPLGLTVALDTDYYIAVSFDNLTGTNDITFYSQDLTNGGALQSTTISSGVLGVKNTGTTFRIGAYGNSAQSIFHGNIDEVRVSDNVLSSSELMVVPEPSSLVLILMSAGVFVLGLRRRG